MAAREPALGVRQEASKELDALIAEGRLVMAFLNAGLRQHYGKDSEKLAEFSLPPFRGRGPAAAGKKRSRKQGGGAGDMPVTPPPAEPPAPALSEIAL